MTRSIDIQLDPATVSGLRRFRRDPVGKVAAGVLSIDSGVTRSPSASMSNSPSGRMTVPNAPWGASESSEDERGTGSAAAGGAEPSVAAAAEAKSPAYRSGDTYIAHYYARLPSDVNQNPYTRLGGSTPHG